VDWDPRASCKNESAEIWEHRYPVRIVDFRLRTDSGGVGRRRGGLGHVKAIELLEDTYLSATVDRNVIPPFGLFGGGPGACNRLTLEIDGVERGFVERFGVASPSKFSNLLAPAGSIYRIYSGGGGGYGPAEERDVEAVVADVRGEYVSLEAAETDYRVAIDPVTLRLDAARTAELRSAAT
jgi:N-methylhydantoinase B/oxoprolinase/acetone carboxylase alpha subunit